ncbi:hypothetical protein [Aneurinibacillus terranovensis]|uniref:hypothetical protein n=1 Tax=Aneurinibacillus terranovensis TaxID=278991 RepID=UPI00041B599F|nr:hypothetical protein [Aneurinibacillus terranovensis]
MGNLFKTALKSEIGAKTFVGAVAGYVIALLSTPFLPDFLSLAIAPAFTFAGFAWGYKKMNRSRRQPRSVQEFIQGDDVLFQTASSQHALIGSESGQSVVEPVSDYAKEVMQSLDSLRDKVIIENNKQNLDNEITDKTLRLVSRIQTMLPYVEEINSIELNHVVKRLVTTDLSSVINPFLRLTGENKIKNRRLILTSLKNIDEKISEIFSDVEQSDLYELDRKATLIAHRYHSDEKIR